ncbi:MAG: hypothetical protein KO464_11380 [Candidatus Methanofastidiosum sp.]|nr:hypothetical protein [Methanofastidiosum sp.]
MNWDDSNKSLNYNMFGRLVVSIVLASSWLIFLILWLFFFATNYNIYQNIAIFLISVIVEGTLQAITWIPLGLKKEAKSN